MRISALPKIRTIIDEIKSLRKDGSAHIFTEQFRALRARFEYQVDVKNYRVVAVTSAIAEEGKTCICANLAANLASTGRKKVLAIDADLRKSDLAHCWKASPRPGLTEFLFGAASLDQIMLNPSEKLYVIPGGERTAEASDLLAGKKFRSFLQEMRSLFDIVLIDTPPLIPVADTMSLRDQIDGFVFVFRVGFTPYVMLRQVLEEMDKDKIIGAVLNRVEPERQKYYQRYYGKYYHKKSE